MILIVRGPVMLLTNPMFTVNSEVLTNLGMVYMLCKVMQSHAKSCNVM